MARVWDATVAVASEGTRAPAQGEPGGADYATTTAEDYDMIEGHANDCTKNYSPSYACSCGADDVDTTIGDDDWNTTDDVTCPRCGYPTRIGAHYDPEHDVVRVDITALADAAKPTWYLTFSTGHGPDGFAGAAFVPALNIAEALGETILRGLGLSGPCVGVELKPVYAAKIPADYIGVRLSLNDVAAIDGIVRGTAGEVVYVSESELTDRLGPPASDPE